MQRSMVLQRDVSACRLLLTVFLLGFFSSPKDGGNMFLRNVGELLSDYTPIYIRRYKFFFLPKV
jgi:hypothetical protein